MSPKRFILSIVILTAIGIGWYLVSPLFFDTIVDEDLPKSGLTPAEETMVDKIESLTPEQVEAMPESERMEEKRKMEELGQKMPDTVTDEPMETQPMLQVSGTFKDADSFHRGSGKATVYALPDGKYVLRFEDFMVTNGPALSVYLVQSADGDVGSGYLDLGKLKGNKGNQNYDIPAGTDLASYRSVVIWCVPFGVMFTTASLQ